MKEFLLSDESINSYGFKVLTSGINLKNFKRNPVMYYNHDRDMGVIGKWTNIYTKGSELFATPVFDEKDVLASKVAGKIKDGFIRAVSIGIDNIQLEKVDGEMIVTACDMIECSVCDIPSNKNALMLYVDDKQVTDKNKIIELCKNRTDMKIDLKPITDTLGLSQNTSIDDIVSAIVALKDSNSPEQMIQDALGMNLIAVYEKDELLQLASASPVAFQNYIEKRKEKALHQREEEGLKLLNVAIRDGRINCDANGKVRMFWLGCFKTDFEGTQLALSTLPARKSVSQMIDNARKSKEDRAGWTLADYRKKAPKELKNNPALYQELVEQEKNKQNN